MWLAPLAAVATAETDAELAEAALHWSVRQATRAGPPGPGDATTPRRPRRSPGASCASTMPAAPSGPSSPPTPTPSSSPPWSPGPPGTTTPRPPIPITSRSRRAWPTPWSRCAPSGGAETAAPAGGRVAAVRGWLAARVAGGMRRASQARGGRCLGVRRPTSWCTPTCLCSRGRDGATGAEAQGAASIEGVGPISAEIVRRLSCDGTHTISLEAARRHHPRPVPLAAQPDGGPAHRDRPARRRVPLPGLRLRPHHQRAPPAALDQRRPDGVVQPDHAVPAHHSRVHELGWTMSGDANGLVTFTSPHGRPSVSSPSPTGAARSPCGNERKGNHSSRRSQQGSVQGRAATLHACRPPNSM